MTPIEALNHAKLIFEETGQDPQAAFAIVSLAELVDNDPQKMLAILRLARFLRSKD